MQFLQITDVSIINIDQIVRIRFIPGSQTKAEYTTEFGQKVERPGTSKTVSTSQLAIDFSQADNDNHGIKLNGEEADRVYASLRAHIQVHQLL